MWRGEQGRVTPTVDQSFEICAAPMGARTKLRILRESCYAKSSLQISQNLSLQPKKVQPLVCNLLANSSTVSMEAGDDSMERPIEAPEVIQHPFHATNNKHIYRCVSFLYGHGSDEASVTFSFMLSNFKISWFTLNGKGKILICGQYLDPQLLENAWSQNKQFNISAIASINKFLRQSMSQFVLVCCFFPLFAESSLHRYKT